jgi:hypothetical protein
MPGFYIKKIRTEAGEHTIAYAYPGVSDLELSEDVLWHVVLGKGVDNEVLVPSRSFAWPVLVTLVL